MVDVGDLREGVMPDRIVALAMAASKLPNLELLGLGANLACYGGVIPSVENMRILIEAREQCRKATGVPLDENKLKDLAKALKVTCGVGGSLKDGVIEIQGDQRDKLKAELEKRGFTVKLAGG